MSTRSLSVWCAVVVILSAAAGAASPGGQGATSEAATPRTPWGHPDLQGIWDFRTITPLERPEELGDRAFLTEPLRPGQ
jgi:hypothetical protein